MMFSKVFVVRRNNYSGVMAQGLEGNCVELRSHGVCSRADWASKLEREINRSKLCVPSWMERMSVSLPTGFGERVDRTKLYILIECMGTE